jgi:hypothetical protein
MRSTAADLPYDHALLAFKLAKTLLLIIKRSTLINRAPRRLVLSSL